MNPALALARTVDLVRADIFPHTGREEIVDALTSVRMRLRADERNLSCAAAQSALVSTAIVAAQSGVELVLDLADVPLVGRQPPLVGSRLTDALLDLTADLITPAVLHDGREADVTIILGSTAAQGSLDLRLGSWRTGFELAAGDGLTTPWTGEDPFAALIGGVAAGTEGFRAAMRNLARSGHRPLLSHAAREPRAVRLALPRTEPSVDLGCVDVISAGAITNGMLFALLRVPGITGQLRLFDADRLEATNLNRYPLGRRSLAGQSKVSVLEGYATCDFQIAGTPARFDGELIDAVSLNGLVVVGVDHVPSRWRVQERAPGTVVVGATSHFEIVVSEHPSGEPCAGCLYRDGDEQPGAPIPTVSFVSTLAGVLQAHRLLRCLTPPARSRQVRAAPLNLAGQAPLIELGVQRRISCPSCC